jgi:hypothetical protein
LLFEKFAGFINLNGKAAKGRKKGRSREGSEMHNNNNNNNNNTSLVTGLFFLVILLNQQ